MPCIILSVATPIEPKRTANCVCEVVELIIILRGVQSLTLLRRANSFFLFERRQRSEKSAEPKPDRRAQTRRSSQTQAQITLSSSVDFPVTEKWSQVKALRNRTGVVNRFSKGLIDKFRRFTSSCYCPIIDVPNARLRVLETVRPTTVSLWLLGTGVEDTEVRRGRLFWLRQCYSSVGPVGPPVGLLRGIRVLCRDNSTPPGPRTLVGIGELWVRDFVVFSWTLDGGMQCRVSESIIGTERSILGCSFSSLCGSFPSPHFLPIGVVD